MKNQFFYTRKEEHPVQIEGKETKYVSYRDSFNVEMVIRTIGLDEGNILVLLNDIHQRPREVPIKNAKGEITSTKREVNTFQSEVILSKEDAERFYEQTNIEKE